MWSAIRSMSDSRCEENRIVRSDLRVAYTIDSSSDRRATGSRPMAGSSRMSRSGSGASAIARHSPARSPRERCRARVFASTRKNSSTELKRPSFHLRVEPRLVRLRVLHPHPPVHRVPLRQIPDAGPHGRREALAVVAEAPCCRPTSGRAAPASSAGSSSCRSRCGPGSRRSTPAGTERFRSRTTHLAPKYRVRSRVWIAKSPRRESAMVGLLSSQVWARTRGACAPARRATLQV